MFENKFPSLTSHPQTPSVEATELYPVGPANGACEVVLYSSAHHGSLTDVSLKRMAELVLVWKDRYLDLGKRPEVEYVFIFENKGEAIGVTIHHPHGQIYAFPFVPPKIEQAIRSENDHYAKTGQCLHCDIVQSELKERVRLVAENDSLVAFIPFYARYPYEVHIYSKNHLPSLADFEDGATKNLAEILQIVLKKYDNLWDMSMPYMMVMYQKPTTGLNYPGSHFRIEFYPPHRTPQKLKYLAGCEAGAGTFVNDTLPEEKAAELRDCAPHK